jgi:magnesium-transporting ATPase (P-type)
MIIDNLEVQTLEPVKYELAEISYVTLPEVHEEEQPKKKPQRGGWLMDLLLRQCFIIFLVLAAFTAINIIGFESFIENLREVINNQGIDGFLVNAHYV